MTIKQTHFAAFTFAIIPGIINILGIRLLGIVLTNVTGHYSSLVQQFKGESWKEAYIFLLYVSLYWFGSFFAASCFIYGNKKENSFIKAIPTLINLGIMLLTLVIESIPVYLFFIATSIQNSFGANHSKNEIRPSQITGVVMASGLDIAKYFFLECPTETKKSIFTSFTNKVLNILGFVCGGLIAFFYTSISLFWIPAIFYFLISILIIKKKI